MNQANERAWVNVTLSAYSIVVPLAAALTGAVFMQAARYLYDREKGFRKDRWLVGTVTAIICLQTIFNVVGLVQNTTRGAAGAFRTPWTITVSEIMSCLTQILVQSHFSGLVFRILRRNRVLQIVWAVFATALISAGLVFGLISGAEFLKAYFVGHVDMSGLLLLSHTAWLLAAAILDTCLSVILISQLLGFVRPEGFQKTNSFLVKFAVTTFETFTLTALTAITAAAASLANTAASAFTGHTLQMVAFGCITCISRFYAASLIYSLDRRQASKFKPTPTPSRQTSKSARPHRPAVVTTGLGDTIPVVLETRDSSFLGAGEGVKVEREVVAHVDQGSTPGDTVEEEIHGDKGGDDVV